MIRRGVYVVLMCLALPLGAAAAAQPDAVAQTIQPASTQQLIKTTVALGVVVVTIFGIAFLAQRYGRFNATGQGQLSIVSSLAVGPKARIVVLRVEKEQIVVGVTPEGISKLHVLTAAESAPVTASAQADQSFAQRLQATLKGRRYED